MSNRELEELRDWLDNNMTFTQSAGNEDTIALASVSRRIWFHVTDDEQNFPFTAVIDAARKESKVKDGHCTECGHQLPAHYSGCINLKFVPKANSSQVGGKHYKGQEIEHWDYCWARKFDFFQYQITKYVERWQKKGGVQDLKKARHFLDKYIEVLEAGEPTEPLEPPVPMPDFLQYVKPDGWVGFTFEGADGQGFHFRCKRCLLRLPGIKQFQPPWEVHNAEMCISATDSSPPEEQPLPEEPPRLDE